MYTEDYIKMTSALKAITQYHGKGKENTFNIIMILQSSSVVSSYLLKWNIMYDQ